MKPDDPHGDLRNIITMHLDGATKTDSFQSLNHDKGIPQAVANIVQTLSLHRGRSAGVYPFNAYKEEDAPEVALKALQATDERRYTLGLSYPANRADRAVAADGFRDFAKADVLENAAWSYLRKGAKVGLLHHKGTEGRGQVVESYIYRGPDWEIDTPSGEKVMIKAGDWLMGIIWDSLAWRAIKTGKLTGLSPQAKVRRRIPSPEDLAGLRSD
jgi:Putative phage serine protease XkdF